MDYDKIFNKTKSLKKNIIVAVKPTKHQIRIKNIKEILYDKTI